MDLRYSDADESFRAELRAWLADALRRLPPRPARDDWPARRAFDTAWQRALFEAGFAGLDWPLEAGGSGAGPTRHLIFLEETERARAPYVGVNFVGLLHAGPTINARGTDEQKRRYLPPILRGDEVWCQGFSEPGAGSDLASLQTRATRDGDDYVVSGQKIWTSHAQVADFCELLVRTDPDAPRHRGITWLVMPMDAPGIDVRPMRTIGGSDEFSEMFLDDVRIPAANRVGEENDGWKTAMVTFSFERGTAFASELLSSRELLKRLVERARAVGAWDDAGTRRALGHLAAESDALWALTKRTVTQAEATGIPGSLGSIFKLRYSEWRHRLGDLGPSILGPDAASIDDEFVMSWIHAISISIAAGTTQIQRSIVGERVLGLPR